MFVFVHVMRRGFASGRQGRRCVFVSTVSSVREVKSRIVYTFGRAGIEKRRSESAALTQTGESRPSRFDYRGKSCDFLPHGQL